MRKQQRSKKKRLLHLHGREFRQRKQQQKKVVADFEKDETSVTQSQIDAAAKALQDALDSVQKRADFTALQEAVDRISKLQLDGYTEESVKVLKDALKEAEAVLEEQEATQNTVDEMLTKLLAAEEALTKEETINWDMVLRQMLPWQINSIFIMFLYLLKSSFFLVFKGFLQLSVFL